MNSGLSRCFFVFHILPSSSSSAMVCMQKCACEFRIFACEHGRGGGEGGGQKPLRNHCACVCT